jgi:hypothetical protein
VEKGHSGTPYTCFATSQCWKDAYEGIEEQNALVCRHAPGRAWEFRQIISDFERGYPCGSFQLLLGQPLFCLKTNLFTRPY